MPTDPADTADLVTRERPRLFGLAYRMLGSVAEAEDAVQEAFARWSQQPPGSVDEPPAWLTTVVSRICVDRLRSARHRREQYVGEWLPEPLATGPDPEEAAGTADSLTFAFLVLLESLSPLERAAFLLHDVFGHDFATVAGVLDRSPAAARQLASRARGHLADRVPRNRSDPAQALAVTEAFLAACAGDDLERVLSLLSPDVVFVGDGGGKATAVPVPLHGAERVGRMLLSFAAVGVRQGVTSDLVEVNHEPALWVRDDDNTIAVMVFEITDGLITAIRGVRNPDKLAGFAPRLGGP